MIYLNTKAYGVVETVDEISRADFKTYAEYMKEVRRLASEYRTSGQDVYVSKRATKAWRDR